MSDETRITLPGIGTIAWEIDLAAQLVPCPRCGLVDEHGVRSASTAQGARYLVRLRCDGCRHERLFECLTDGNPVMNNHRVGERSRLLDADALRAEIERVAPRIDDDPRRIDDPAAWRSMRKAVSRTLSCALWLVPFGDEGAPAQVERMRALERRMVADELRVRERETGRSATAREELRGIIAQLVPEHPSLDALRTYFETRRTHRATQASDAAVSIAMRDDPTVPDRLVRVHISADASGFGALLTFAALDVEHVIMEGWHAAINVVGGPSWDERANDWERPLADPIVTILRVKRDENATKVTLTSALRGGPPAVGIRFEFEAPNDA